MVGSCIAKKLETPIAAPQEATRIAHNQKSGMIAHAENQFDGFFCRFNWTPQGNKLFI